MPGVKENQQDKRDTVSMHTGPRILCLHHCPLTGIWCPGTQKRGAHSCEGLKSSIMDEKKKTKELKRIHHARRTGVQRKKTRVKRSARRRKARKRTPFSCHHTIFHHKSFGHEYLLGQKEAASAPTWRLLTSHVTRVIFK